MDFLVSRIQRSLEHAGLSWSGAAIKLGLSPQAATNWKKGKIGRDTLKALAGLTGVNAGWLLDGSGLMVDVIDNNEAYRPVMAWEAPDDLDPDSFMIIPHVDIKFSAGNGRLVEFEPTPKMTGCAQRLEWFHKKKVSPKNLVEVDVDGDSMEPRIPNGSVVIIDKSINSLEQVQNRKVYAIRYGDELKIKRLSRRYDGSLIIDSDNPNYEREIVEPQDLEHIGIIGKYVSHSYDGEI
ncbi:S24 family peptidase [Acinetobacter venetianus]|uniref:Putative HTH-type transcriptional regulator n=1 Tax=Acinetobacter venetianus TaxID=52133 RepID=A0A150HRD4_9GAMM|nr:S24 family peptidase [Acinetobacter venetianus]KXZ68800.1 putative HTH-type transcriptional regulator [Acinetobacter venetianus]